MTSQIYRSSALATMFFRINDSGVGECCVSTYPERGWMTENWRRTPITDRIESEDGIVPATTEELNQLHLVGLLGEVRI